MNGSICHINSLDRSELVLFCEQNKYSNIYHQILCSQSFEIDLSIVVRDKKSIIGYCPLVVESTSINGVIYNVGMIHGLSLPSLIFKNDITNLSQIKRLIQQILSAINEQAKVHNVSKVIYNLYNYQHYPHINSILYNEMKKLQFIDATLQMQQLDITKPPLQIITNFSKGHRSIIKKVKKCNVIFFNIDTKKLTFESFRKEINEQAVNIVTELYYLYQNKYLEFCDLIYSNSIVARIVFLKYKNVVHYYRAKTFRNCDMPLHHIMLWEAIKKYHAESYEALNFGIVVSGPYFNYIPDHKQLMIARFKKGFGGSLSPFLCLEKYFNKDMFKIEYNSRLEKLVNLMN